MPLSDLIAPEAVIPGLRAANKKAVLIEMSERAALTSGLPARDIFDAVLQRERLGSTGIGNGVAIPHGKFAGCERIFGVFARLDKPIDFEAMDGAPVDLVFLLIASEMAGADHLKALARVARFLRDPKVVVQLRATRDIETLSSILLQMGATSHAA
jgi:nitrogen PTS system EIIA component